MTSTLPTDPETYPPAAGDLTALVQGDTHPATTEPMSNVPATQTPGSEIPIGVHPYDARSPLAANGQLPSEAPGEGDLYPGAQGDPGRRPWSTANVEAFPVFQRSASDWSANTFTLGPAATQEPIQLAGRRRGRVSVIIWVPTAATFGVVIAPTQGEVQSGGSAGVTLSPGDSIELPTEAAIWGASIGTNASGSANVVELVNPPGGGLGLAAG